MEHLLNNIGLIIMIVVAIGFIDFISFKTRRDDIERKKEKERNTKKEKHLLTELREIEIDSYQRAKRAYQIKNRFKNKELDVNLKDNNYNYKKEYEKYLLSTKWKEKAHKIREKFNYKCQMCGDDGIDVHHITYENFSEEKEEDLTLLCKSCHKKIHEFHGENAKYYPII